MKIDLVRIYNCPTYCIGKLYIDGVYQCDTVEDTDRGLDDSMTEEQVRKIKVYKMTAIPTGTYKVTMNVQSPKFSQYTFYKNLCNGYLPRLLKTKGFDGVLIHCLTPDMEILTEHGWKNYEEFKTQPENKCYSYNTETGEIELTPIDNFIEQDYEGELYCSHGRVCYSVTDKHRMWVYVKKRDGSFEWQWRTADDICQGTKFITAGYKPSGWKLTAQQKLLYRIIIATQADGYILNWSRTASQVKFHFKKERKIQRMKELLDELGDSYKIYKDSEGATHISLSPTLSEYITEVMNPQRNVYNTKELPIELLSLRAEDMKDLVMDYLFWDGRWENYLKNTKDMVISSTKKRTIDILQAMAFMSGFRTTQYKAIRKNNRHENCIDLKLYSNQELTLPEPSSRNVEEYKGRVWCVSNSNHTIIVRQGGHVCVIGNCGTSASNSAGCLLVGENLVKGKVLNSQKTFTKLMKQFFLPAKILGNEITITISRKYKVELKNINTTK